MTRLLFVQASPRKSASRSIAIAEAYVEALAANIPQLEVDRLELWDEPLPEFDGDRVSAKLAVMRREAHSARQKTVWDEIVEVAQRFMRADIYLFAVPMWNSGVPYRLKQYIDVVHQPGLLFRLDPTGGYVGLLKNKKAVLVYTAGAFSAQAPSPAFGVDHHSTYMRVWLNQAGVRDIAEIRFQPTSLTPNYEADFTAAKAEAVRLASA